MADKTYENFDIHIGSKNEGLYPIRVTNAGLGAQTRAPIWQKFPLDDVEFSDLVDYAHDLIATEADAKAIGEKLKKLLFPDAVWDLFNQRYGVVLGANKRLRIRLCIEPAELNHLPWELCYFDTHDSFFALLPQTPLIRYIAEPFNEGDVTAVPTQVKILLATANPTGDLQVKKESERIMEALTRLGNRVEVIALPDATYHSLQTALDTAKPHVLHFIGHGKQGALMMAGPSGQEVSVPAISIRSIIAAAAEESLKVVVLNACHSASADVRGASLGVAQAILRTGVPAVVAMQTLVPDKLAVDFAYTLYDRLAQAQSLDEAVTAMRRSAHAEANLNGATPELGGYFGCIPVLFMHDSGTAQVWKPAHEVGAEPEKKGVSTAVFQPFLMLDYNKQVRAFRNAPATATASLLSSPASINNNKNHLRLLLRRLISGMPKSVAIKPFLLDINATAPNAPMPPDGFWFHLAQNLKLTTTFSQPYSDADKQTITQAVIARLETEPLVMAIENVTEPFYPFIVNDFWQPLYQSLSKVTLKHRFILFIVDNAGHCSQEPQSNFFKDKPGFDVDIPVVKAFDRDTLVDWFWDARGLATDAKLQKWIAQDEWADEILQKSLNGLPEMALKHICDTCGYEWDGIFANWLKSP
jgi:hypothetical protein